VIAGFALVAHTPGDQESPLYQEPYAIRQLSRRHVASFDVPVKRMYCQLPVDGVVVAPSPFVSAGLP